MWQVLGAYPHRPVCYCFCLLMYDDLVAFLYFSFSFQGYVIYSVRKKLKKQYMHLKGKQIEKLKKSGVEVCISCRIVFFFSSSMN